MHGRIEVVHTRRPGANELGVVMQQGAERRDVAVDHGFDGALESRDRSVLTHRVDVLGQAPPVGELVPPCHRQQRIIAIDRHRAHLLVRHVPLEPRNLVVEKLRVAVTEDADGFRVTGIPTGQKRIGLLLVFGERRIEGERSQHRYRGTATQRLSVRRGSGPFQITVAPGAPAPATMSKPIHSLVAAPSGRYAATS